MAEYISAASSTERVIGPGVSRVGLRGRTPYVLTRPTLVLSAVIPHQDAGSRTEPPVSVPTAQGASPAATATPEPLLEPPGVRWRLGSHGFQGVPRREFVDEVDRRKPSCGNVGGELVHGAEGQFGVRHVALCKSSVGAAFTAR
jgi:hypothetical protein